MTTLDEYLKTNSPTTEMERELARRAKRQQAAAHIWRSQAREYRALYRFVRDKLEKFISFEEQLTAFEERIDQEQRK